MAKQEPFLDRMQKKHEASDKKLGFFPFAMERVASQKNLHALLDEATLCFDDDERLENIFDHCICPCLDSTGKKIGIEINQRYG